MDSAAAKRDSTLGLGPQNRDGSTAGLGIGTGKAGNRAYEYALRVRLLLEGAESRIADIVLEPLLGTDLGEVAALPEMLLGRTAEEALGLIPRALAELLGGLPESEMYRCVLFHEALRVALADAQGEKRDPAERVLACTCLAVPEALIRRAVRMNGLTRLEEVRAFTKAGANCAQCTTRVAAVLANELARR